MSEMKETSPKLRPYLEMVFGLGILVLIVLALPHPFHLRMAGWTGPLFTSYELCLDAAVVMCIAKASLPDHRWVRPGFTIATLGMVSSLVAAIAYQADSPTQFWLKLSEPIRQGLQLIS
jgi:hypothetical protein